MRTSLPAIAVVSLILTACGDDSGSVVTECRIASDCPGSGFACLENRCVPTGPGFDAVEGGTTGGTPDAGSTTGGGGQDVPPAPDLIPDNDPPTVVSISPADGATGLPIPFEITITFSEPVKNVEANTVQMMDASGSVVTGTFTASQDQTTHTFAPNAAQLSPTSPYTLTVNFPVQVILDSAGNKMQGLFEATVFTGPPNNLSLYDNLASSYAPNLAIAAPPTYPFKPQYEVPTRLNVDGDWDITNNKAYIDKNTTTSLSPAVHYAVLESHSHYYIHYVYYWSRRDDKFDDGVDPYANDTAGALVVVEKWPQERPVELLTWFKINAHEYIRSFQTSESGVFGGSQDNEAVDGIYTQDELFPGGRFNAFVSAGRHHSCLWDDPGQDYGIVTTCDLPPGEKETWSKWTFTPGPTATPVAKNGAAWPVNGAAQYELVDLLREWWPRRTLTDVLFYDGAKNYTHHFDDKTWVATFPRNLVSDVEDEQGQGRTPFGVIWKPGDGKQFQDGLAQGMFFFDPAAFLAARHKSSPYFVTPFDAAAKTGFSTAWCFNPYLGIDNRGVGDVCPQ